MRPVGRPPGRNTEVQGRPATDTEHDGPKLVPVSVIVTPPSVGQSMVAAPFVVQPRTWVMVGRAVVQNEPEKTASQPTGINDK